MIRNPYDKIALSSTKKFIIFIVAILAVIFGGLFIGAQDGFNVRQELSNTLYTGESTQNLKREVLYSINLTYAIFMVFFAIGVIVVRRDLAGVIVGIILLLFAFFVMPVGIMNSKSTAASNNEKMTMFTMLVDAIKA